MGKLEQVLIGHENCEVTCLQFVQEYPLLVSSSVDGTVCLWGTRGSGVKYRYKCIARIIHTYRYLTKTHTIGKDGEEIIKDRYIEKRVSVNSLAVSFDEKVGIPISSNLKMQIREFNKS